MKVGRHTTRRAPDDGFVRESFTLPREEARQAAWAYLKEFPKEAYMTSVETWRRIAGDQVEFTMQRLPSAD